MAANENGSDVPGLKGKLELMHIIERLKTQTRTGWVNVKVPGRVESIADHMYRMAMLSLLSEEDEELDIAKCVQMAVVHDLAEALVGDITPHDGISKAQKQKLEEDAMHTLTKVKLDKNGPASKRIQALFEEYEQRSTKEARFVKDLDLLEMALQGSEYEADRASDQIQPFFQSSIPKIQHPEVRKWAHALMEERRARRSQDPTYEHIDVAPSVPAQAVAIPTETAKAIETPNKLLQLAPSSIPVTDADDEIFDLYTQLSSSDTQQWQQRSQGSKSTSSSSTHSSEHNGLGFVDAKKNTLHISIDVPKLSLPTSPSSRPRARAKRRPSLPQAGSSGPSQGKDSPKLKGKGKEVQYDTVEVEIQQDLGGLHARAGDTGSVVWKASVLFATFVLHQMSLSQHDLFMPELFADAEVLELGGGTGVLSSLLAPCVRSWTVTDISDLLPLIQKNIEKTSQRLASSDVRLAELDWTWSSQQYERNAKSLAQRDFDLVIAVDCLFNEALVQPFVNTLNRIKSKYVIVISELRSADVLQLFLELWLASGPWTVYRPVWSETRLASEEAQASAGLFGRRHVIWVGWKRLV